MTFDRAKDYQGPTRIVATNVHGVNITYTDIEDENPIRLVSKKNILDILSKVGKPLKLIRGSGAMAMCFADI